MGIPRKEQSLENRELGNEAKPFKSTTVSFPPPATPPNPIFIKKSVLDDLNDLNDLFSTLSKAISQDQINVNRLVDLNEEWGIDLNDHFPGKIENRSDSTPSKSSNRSPSIERTINGISNISNIAECLNEATELLHVPIDDRLTDVEKRY